MPITTFEESQIGDMVWDIVYGWGVISMIGPSEKQYPITVTTMTGSKFLYTFKGVPVNGHIQTLFWDEVDFTFEAPQMPKRTSYINTRSFRRW